MLKTGSKMTSKGSSFTRNGSTELSRRLLKIFSYKRSGKPSFQINCFTRFLDIRLTQIICQLKNLSNEWSYTLKELPFLCDIIHNMNIIWKPQSSIVAAMTVSTCLNYKCTQKIFEWFYHYAFHSQTNPKKGAKLPRQLPCKNVFEGIGLKIVPKHWHHILQDKWNGEKKRGGGK